MKKLIITSSVLLLATSLVGCNTLGGVSRFGSNTVGTTMGTGVKLVSSTGQVVGTTVGQGMGFLTGQTVTNRDMNTYHRKGMIYRNGHYYKVHHGKYMLVR